MKVKFLTAALLLFVSCATEKEVGAGTVVTENNEIIIDKTGSRKDMDTPPPPPLEYYIGVVSLEKNMCGVTIQVNNKAIPDFYPVNLDEMFKIQGATIQFNATVSRAKSPEGCTLLPMALSNVTRVKK